MTKLNKKILAVALSGLIITGSGFTTVSSASSYPALKTTQSKPTKKTTTIYVSKADINKHYPANLNKYKSIVNGVAKIIPSKTARTVVKVTYATANTLCKGKTKQIDDIKKKIASGKAKGMKITLTENPGGYPAASMSISTY